MERSEIIVEFGKGLIWVLDEILEGWVVDGIIGCEFFRVFGDNPTSRGE